MNHQLYRLVAISNKSSGMLAALCKNLSANDSDIDSISSLRLGHSYVVVLMLTSTLEKNAILKSLDSYVDSHEVQLFLSNCEAEKKKYAFIKSDAFIRVRGAPEKGMNTRIISLLTDAGLEIHGLESSIFTKNEQDKFVINIKGKANDGIEGLAEIAADLQEEGLDITVSTDWSLLI